jgi:VWFA-related protein
MDFMKQRPSVYLLASVLLCATGFAQQDLPSAPSASAAPEQHQAQPQQPAQTAPATEPKNQPLVLQSLEDRKKQPTPQTQTQAQKPASSTPAAANSTKGNLDDSLLPPPDSAVSTAATDKPSAATDSGKENPDDFRVTKKVDEVNVIFTVTDKHGKFIKDLKKDDFSVLDDKRPVDAVRNFAAQTNLPLRVGLLVDASNSIRDRFKFEQEAAIEFLNQIVRPSDEAFTIGFDSTTEVTQDFTNNTELLAKGVRMLRPGGGTALYDAVYRACKEKLMAHPDKSTVRRAIILLSDGDDNQSRVTREEAIEMAERAEVVIYAISTNLADKGRGDRELQRMAEATGGRAFFPFKIEEVANAFSDIQEELRSQYAIAYKPNDFVADGKYRSIDIETKNNKLKVRSRKGYFAPKS